MKIAAKAKYFFKKLTELKESGVPAELLKGKETSDYAPDKSEYKHAPPTPVAKKFDFELSPVNTSNSSTSRSKRNDRNEGSSGDATFDPAADCPIPESCEFHGKPVVGKKASTNPESPTKKVDSYLSFIDSASESVPQRHARVKINAKLALTSGIEIRAYNLKLHCEETRCLATTNLI